MWTSLRLAALSSTTLIRWGGLAAVLAGALRAAVSFWPYSDLDIAVELLYLLIDILILFGILGVYGFLGEQPGVAGFLGADYVVESSIGHIRDLPQSAAETPATVVTAAAKSQPQKRPLVAATALALVELAATGAYAAMRHGAGPGGTLLSATFALMLGLFVVLLKVLIH